MIFITKKAILSKTLIATLGAAGALAMANTASADTQVQVQAGDTLSAIAQKYDSSVDAIAQRNQLANPNVIYVGQKLIIPNSATSATSAVASQALTSAGLSATTSPAASSSTSFVSPTVNLTNATNNATTSATTLPSTAASTSTTTTSPVTPNSTAASSSVSSNAASSVAGNENSQATTTTSASAAPTTYAANSAAAHQAMANYTIQYGTVAATAASYNSTANTTPSSTTAYSANSQAANDNTVNAQSGATTQSATASQTATNQSTSAAVNTARSMIGVPYVWGGNTPAGFDCSGLVQYSYNLGPNYRTTYQQTNLGQHKYDVENAQSGDLYFWGTESAPYHVAIAEGNGNYIQAPTPGQNVQEGNIQYYRPNFYISMNQ